MDKYHYPPDMGDTEQNSNDDIRPRIIITGLKRSGKSSIHKVVFHKMSPNETLFLESHNKALSDSVQNNSFIRFNIWEFPEHPDEQDQRDFEVAVLSSGALVFVIDSQDEYGDALSALNTIVRKAHGINPNMNFEVFIHKVDGLSDDHKIEARQEIHQRANEEFIEQVDEILLSFYLTSIYDHSIFEAFSKVVQKLIPQMPILENLLNVFISNSGIEKAFLFDATSKIFVATDSSPVDMQSYELCCDMIDVVMDISCIYGTPSYDENIENRYKGTSASIRLNSGTVLYLREVNHYLALVCILREDNFNKQGLIDYNFQCFRQSIQDVFHFTPTGREEKDVNLANESPYGSSVAFHNGPDQQHHHAYSADGDLSTSLDTMERRTSTPIHSNFKLSSPQMSPAAAPHRKTPIVPSNSIPSSLPNHQATFHVSPSGADKAKLHSQATMFGAYNNGSISERRVVK